jgi:sulfatase modifying factor 1
MRRTMLYALAPLTVLVLMGSTAWANSAPVVSSVTAAQRPDKMVDIRYDLADADGDACTISVQVSNDAGATWALSAKTVTGAVGGGIAPSAGKLIVWDSKVDLPGVVGSQFKVRICADDGHNQPPQVSNPTITGALMQVPQGTVQFSCTATDPDGTVLSVAVDLTAIGGSSAEALSKGIGDRWQGSAPVTPSSRGLKSVTFTATDNRGATGSAQASIKVAPFGMVLIPAGEFQMGDPFINEGDTNERPSHAVYVDELFMDRYQVTNQQYADALNWAWGRGGMITVTSGVVYKAASGTSYPYCDTTTRGTYSQITWNGSTFGVAGGKENHPMVAVSWYGSVAYANWRSGMQSMPLCYDLSTWNCNWGSGYRLPTEAEWERAARGGVAGHRFPWSDTDTIQHSRANYLSSTTYYYDTSPTRGYHPTFNTGVYPYSSPVGYFAANGYGLYDMAGNVWEWCNDWFDGSYYSNSPYNNPHGPASGSNHVLRGGSWGSLAINLRCAYRSNGVPDYRYMINGFRLTMDSD